MLRRPALPEQPGRRTTRSARTTAADDTVDEARAFPHGTTLGGFLGAELRGTGRFAEGFDHQNYGDAR